MNPSVAIPVINVVSITTIKKRSSCQKYSTESIKSSISSFIRLNIFVSSPSSSFFNRL
nr:MAG TPA: hypothetical protein [Caudoviricetes sp.]